MRRFARFGSICKKREKHPWRSITFIKVAGRNMFSGCKEKEQWLKIGQNINEIYSSNDFNFTNFDWLTDVIQILHFDFTKTTETVETTKFLLVNTC